MAIQVINLGQISAFYSGTSAPANTTILWYDTTPGINKQKYYDKVAGAWVLLATGGGAQVIVEDVLTSTNTTTALSANQGRILNNLINSVNSTLSGNLNTSNQNITALQTSNSNLNSRVTVLENGQGSSGISGSYGSANQTVVFTTSAGSVTAATPTAILINSGQVSDFVNKVNSIIAAKVNIPSGLLQLNASGLVDKQYLPAGSGVTKYTASNATVMTNITTAVIGDICIRTDLNGDVYELTGSYQNISDWRIISSSYLKTFNGSAGPNISVTTDQIPQGVNNKYYTTAQVASDLAGLLIAGQNMSIVYNAINNNYTLISANDVPNSLTFNAGTNTLSLGITNGQTLSVALPITIANGSITYQKLSTSNNPTVNSVLGYTAAGMTWLNSLLIPLTGFDNTLTGPISALDSPITAFGKLQNQITTIPSPNLQNVTAIGATTTLGITVGSLTTSGNINAATGTISGIITGPTAAPGTTSFQLATCAFVAAAISTVAGGMQYVGVWNASTNTPNLTSGIGTKGYLYKVSVAGTTMLDGVSQWNVGDQVVFDGTAWDKIDGIASEVLSFNSRVGVIVLSSSDVTGALTFTPYNSTNPSNFIALTALSAAGPLNYTNTTGAFTINQATTAISGYLSFTDWNTFNGKQNALGYTPYNATNPANYITLASHSAATPLVYNNTTGAFTIIQSTTSASGYLSNTDWNTFNNKQPALGFTPYNATNPNAYISLTGISATGPINYVNTSGIISIAQATTSVSGYLSATDWTTFNNKLTSYNGILNQTALQASSNFNISGTGTAGTFATTTNLNITSVSTAGKEGLYMTPTSGAVGYNILFGNGGNAGFLSYGIFATTANNNIITNPPIELVTVLGGSASDVAGQDIVQITGTILGNNPVVNRNILNVKNTGTSLLAISPTMITATLPITTTFQILTPQASAPTTPTNGTVYYNTTTTNFQFYQNGAWATLGIGASAVINQVLTGFTATSGTVTATDSILTGLQKLQYQVSNIPAGGVTSFNTRSGAVVLTSSDVTSALTFTPYNSTNPTGYITNSALANYAILNSNVTFLQTNLSLLNVNAAAAPNTISVLDNTLDATSTVINTGIAFNKTTTAGSFRQAGYLGFNANTGLFQINSASNLTITTGSGSTASINAFKVTTAGAASMTGTLSISGASAFGGVIISGVNSAEYGLGEINRQITTSAVSAGNNYSTWYRGSTQMGVYGYSDTGSDILYYNNLLGNVSINTTTFSTSGNLNTGNINAANGTFTNNLTAASFTVYATTAATNNYSVTATTPAYSGYNTVFGDGYSTATILYGITTTVPNITVLNTQPLFQNLISLAGTSPDVAGQDLFSFNAYISGAPSTAILNRNLLSIKNNGVAMLTVSPIGNTMVGGSLIVSNAKSGGIYFNTTANYTVINTGYSYGIEQNITTGVIGAFTSGASNTAGGTTLKTFLYGFDANSNLTFTSNVPVITVTNNMAVQGYFTGALKTNGSLQAGINSPTTTASNHILSSASVTGTPSSKYQILNIGTTNQISFFAETNGSSSIGFNTNTNAGNTTNTANEAGFAATMNFNQSTGAFSFLNTATTVALNGILPFAYALTIDKSGNGILSGQLSAQNINLSIGGVAAQSPYGAINVSVPNNATSYTAFSILQPGNIGWGMGINSGVLFIGQGGSAAANGANTTMQQLFTFNNLGNFTANGSGTFAGTVASKGFKAAINGAASDPYAPISVTNIADASNHSYYSLTRSGVVAWNIGITGSGNSLFFGSGGSLTANGDNIASSTVFILDASGNGTLAGAITSKGTNKQIITISAAYTVLTTDEVIQCQGTTGAYTVTLPAAGASFLGKVITLVRDPNSSGATITVTVASAAAIQSPTGGYGSTVPLGLSGAAGSRLSYINNGGGGWVLLSSF